MTMSSTNGSPTCWICLCDEPDDTGLLPVRDCSCRGDTGAGYAHLSCIVQYAQTKSKEASNNNKSHDKFFEAWQTCPNCEQEYQHQLAIDLSDSLLEFMDKNYGEFNTLDNYSLMITALLVKITAIKMASLDQPDLRSEGIKTTNKMLTLLDVMKTKYITSNSTLQLRKAIAGKEASAYGHLVTFYILDKSEESRQKTINYCQKSMDLYNYIGDTETAFTMEHTMQFMKNGGYETAVTKRGVLESMRDLAKDQAKKFGCNSAEAISTATTLAQALSLARHSIEAERILTKYLVISRRVHGEGHDQTKEIEKSLSQSQARFVILESGKGFQALRYEDNGDKVVIEGPVTVEDAGNYMIMVPIEGASVYTVDSSSMIIADGTPIVCQGLQKGAHLNGNLADVRSFDKNKERYTIYFEDTKLKPVAVKKENVRIVFDLPDPE